MKSAFQLALEQDNKKQQKQTESQSPDQPKQEVQDLINRNVAVGNDPGKGLGEMLNVGVPKPRRGQTTDDGLENTAPKDIKQSKDYGKIDYVGSGSESAQKTLDRFNQAREAGIIPWERQQWERQPSDSATPYDDVVENPYTQTPYSSYGQNGQYGQYGYPYDVSSIEDINNMLEPYHLPTDKELKREKRDMMIRALGDGISAIAGMAGSIAGGENTINPDASLTKTGMERADKLREERRKNYTAYLNSALKREQASAAKLRAMSAAERNRFTAETQRMKAERAIIAAERKLEMAETKQAAEIAHKEAMDAISQMKAEAYARWVDGKLSDLEYRRQLEWFKAETQRMNSIRAGKSGGGSGKSGSSSSGRSGGGSSSGGGKTTVKYDEYGNPTGATWSGTGTPPATINPGAQGSGRSGSSGGNGGGSGSATRDFLRGNRGKKKK